MAYHCLFPLFLSVKLNAWCVANAWLEPSDRWWVTGGGGWSCHFLWWDGCRQQMAKFLGLAYVRRVADNCHVYEWHYMWAADTDKQSNDGMQWLIKGSWQNTIDYLMADEWGVKSCFVGQGRCLQPPFLLMDNGGVPWIDTLVGRSWYYVPYQYHPTNAVGWRLPANMLCVSLSIGWWVW